MTTRTRLVLACAGSARTNAAIPPLARQYGADVVTVTLDLGQGGDLDDVRERAIAAGAVRAHVLDVREEFAREYILPALRAGALQGTEGSATGALASALVARKLVEIAQIEQATIAAHGYLPGTVDQTRIEAAVRALDASLRIVAIPGATAPSDTMAAARPAVPAADSPASVELTFDRGTPVAINGVEMTLTELLDSVATIAAGHGVVRDVVQAAHEALEACVTPMDLLDSRREHGARYAAIIDRGDWFSPERDALDAFCAALQDTVTGVVRVELFKGACTIAGRRSPFALEPTRA